MRKTASFIAKREGKKSQAKICDIRESLKVYVQGLAEEYMLGDGGPLKTELEDAIAKELTKLRKARAKSFKQKAA